MLSWFGGSRRGSDFRQRKKKPALPLFDGRAGFWYNAAVAWSAANTPCEHRRGVALDIHRLAVLYGKSVCFVNASPLLNKEDFFMASIGKARFWVGVLYPENMRADWQDKLPDIVQVPFAYCVHNADKDSKSEHRKDHVHLILAFSNTTTYKHAMGVFGLLSAEGRQAINKCEAVINIRHQYDYLIHDTDNCRKQHKELYPPEARVTGNNFDIGAYEQLSTADKSAMCAELCNAIIAEQFTNFADFYVHAMSTYVAQDSAYFEIIRTYSGLFERLTRGNYQKITEQEQRFSVRRE